MSHGDDAIVGKVEHLLNPDGSSGEEVSITTYIHHNGDGCDDDPLYLTHELFIHSYGNSVSVSLTSATFTPELLREMASDIEKEQEVLKNSSLGEDRNGGVSPDSDYVKPMFSIDSYDRDGDLIDGGLFLHFDDTRIKVANSLEGFESFIDHLEKIKDELVDSGQV